MTLAFHGDGLSVAIGGAFLYEICSPRPALPAFSLGPGRWILAIYVRHTGQKIVWRTDLESFEQAEAVAQRHHRLAVMSG